MNKILKKLSLVLFSIILTFSNISSLLAASATISVSSSSSKVVVGNTFSVTIKVSSSSALGTWEFTPSYDTSKLKMTSGQSSIVDYGNGSAKSKSYTFKFKAISTGSAKISVKSYGVIDYKTESKMSVSVSSKTVTIISESELKASYSSNNNLKSLSVEGLKLSPSFSKNTTSYKVTAESNTTKVNIKASVEDSKSSISGTGTKTVNEGENKFNIVVTAQNGNKKTYTVIVDVIDPTPIEVTIGEDKYTVVKRESALPKEEGFTSSSITINDQKVPCLYNEINKYYLVGLKDKDGKTALYLYDSENNTYKLYEDAKLKQMNIVPLELESNYKPEDKREQITIDNVIFNAIKLNANGLYILKARNLEDGKEDYYEYDEQTNTLIRYVEEEKEEDTDTEEIQKYKKMLVILSIETVIVILILISILINKMRKNSKRKRMIEEEKEKIKKKNEKKKEVNNNDKKKKKN